MDMRGGRIVLLVLGVLLALVGVGLAATGAVALGAHATQRDADGYLTTPNFELASDGYALTAEELELVTTPGDWTGWLDRLDLRLSVTSATDAEVFVGIGPEDEVDTYLATVAHDRVLSLEGRGREARYRSIPGDTVPAPPGEQDIWAAQTAGPGTQTLTWPAETGRWTAVVMHADATPGVAIAAEAGARTDLLLPVGLALFIVGLVVLGGAAAMIVASVQSPGVVVPASETAVPTRATPYPLALRGSLDPTVSRWQWLVKWLLLIPHIVVLMVLGGVFVILTFVAGVAILATGRYPRGLFDLNVGILRWAWRVTFYGYGVLGTDRYPPFSLDAADYPAELTVAYPERLSRGLVLVKWWLLALPHYLIVAVLTGGALSWTFGTTTDDSWRVSTGGGLIGVLVLVTGIVLLVQARYPRGMFDLLMGLNRWVFRVIAYAALMTDVYPPFRLDNGGEEPPPPPPPATPGPSDGTTRRHPEPIGG
jgi:hypothetical protein